MEIQVGIVERNDFNYDYQVSSTSNGEQAGKARSITTTQLTRFPSEERPGASMFYQERWRNFPYVLDLCARTRHSAADVQLARHDGQGAR